MASEGGDIDSRMGGDSGERDGKEENCVKEVSRCKLLVLLRTGGGGGL